LAYAPKDFVGVMDTAVDLRLPNDTLVDSQVMRLEWVAKKAEIRAVPQRPDREEARAVGVFRPLDAVEVEALVKRGQEYMKIGDITSARLALRRAVSAGSAQAAFALGATFDPVVLGELGVLGFAPDAAQARAWYQRAAELGSTEASRRIERLAKSAN
jgi:TPR repeat protein